jgi:hypothetical protein
MPNKAVHRTSSAPVTFDVSPCRVQDTVLTDSNVQDIEQLNDRSVRAPR